MAGWISSKLKVAENLLQQIDQQAAESLGKGERKQSDGSDFTTSPKPSGSVSLRDQLKKKTPENNKNFGKLSRDSASSSASKINSDDNSGKQNWGKEVTKPNSNLKSTLRDSDWTELLSTPKQPIGTKTNSANGASGGRGGRKVGGKVGNVGLNVKGNGKAVGTVRKAGDGDAGKANSGVGDGRGDREQDSMNSYSTTSALGMESDDKMEGSEFSQALEKVGNPEEDKEKENERDITGNGNGNGKESLDYNKLVVKAGSSFLGNKPDMVSGSNQGVAAQVSNKADKVKEAVCGDEKISKTTLTANNPNGNIANYISGDLKNTSYSLSDDESDSDSAFSSTSDSEVEREREEKMQRRRQILAAKALAKAMVAITEQENLVARLEGEKQSLEKILEERAKQAAQEASELQSTMMEIMDAAELEKQKHNHTRMEVLARLAKLETANADLAKCLATAQWNLEIEVNHVAQLRQQVEEKEAVHEELKGRISSTNESRTSLTSVMPSKGFVLEKEMLEAEYCFVTDKIVQLQDKATKLEANIDLMQKEVENATEVEVELKRRLCQMTDHLIQKQSQVEALSSDKALLFFRMEAVSRLLDENKPLTSVKYISGSSREDLEAGTWESTGSKLRPMLEDKIQSGKQHLGSLLRQFDAIFSFGAIVLTRNPAAKLWSLVYLVCLHLWVLYILFSRSESTEDSVFSSVVSSGNISDSVGV